MLRLIRLRTKSVLKCSRTHRSSSPIYKYSVSRLREKTLKLDPVSLWHDSVLIYLLRSLGFEDAGTDFLCFQYFHNYCSYSPLSCVGLFIVAFFLTSLWLRCLDFGGCYEGRLKESQTQVLVWRNTSERCRKLKPCRRCRWFRRWWGSRWFIWKKYPFL